MKAESEFNIGDKVMAIVGDDELVSAQVFYGKIKAITFRNHLNAPDYEVEVLDLNGDSKTMVFTQDSLCVPDSTSKIVNRLSRLLSKAVVHF